jgi:hypothetical protein
MRRLFKYLQDAVFSLSLSLALPAAFQVPRVLLSVVELAGAIGLLFGRCGKR